MKIVIEEVATETDINDSEKTDEAKETECADDDENVVNVENEINEVATETDIIDSEKTDEAKETKCADDEEIVVKVENETEDVKDDEKSNDTGVNEREGVTAIDEENTD